MDGYIPIRANADLPHQAETFEAGDPLHTCGKVGEAVRIPTCELWFMPLQMLDWFPPL
jgi:hypothetical protein